LNRELLPQGDKGDSHKVQTAALFAMSDSDWDMYFTCGVFWDWTVNIAVNVILYPLAVLLEKLGTFLPFFFL